MTQACLSTWRPTHRYGILLVLKRRGAATTLQEDEAVLDDLYKDDSAHDFDGTTHKRNGAIVVAGTAFRADGR